MHKLRQALWAQVYSLSKRSIDPSGRKEKKLPQFSIIEKKLKLNKPINFKLEKELQNLIEDNLEVVFNCRFIASEFSTGNEHSGRIDSLGLSEDNNPVILEYKKVESSELVNQSLYYLSWIKDHKGDFQIAVNNKLGKNIEIDWSDVRVICIAPGYKKYHCCPVKNSHLQNEAEVGRFYQADQVF